MLDIKKIKENPDGVKAGLRAKEVNCDEIVDRILELDVQIRALKTSSETKTAQKNKLSKENGKLFGMKKGAEKQGKDTAELDAQIAKNNAESSALNASIEEEAAQLSTLSAEYRTCMLSLPNLPTRICSPAARRITSLCAMWARSRSSISSPSTMLTCVKVWVSSTMSAAPSWQAPATGCTPAWARDWNGRC